MAVLEFNQLLEPINPESPSGTDPREDADPSTNFWLTKGAYQAAHRAEKSADQNIERHTNEEFRAWLTDSRDDWIEVREHAQAVLTTQAKDLEVTTMLTEALLRRDGFAGFAEGLGLIHALIEAYSDSIHPRIAGEDEGESSMDLRKVAGLGGSDLANRLTRYQITGGSSLGPFAYWQFAQAQRIESLQGKEKEDLLNRGGVSLQQFRLALSETPDAELLQIHDGLQATRERYKQLDQLLQTFSPKDAPSFRPAQQVIDQCISTLEKLVPDRLAPKPPHEEPVGEEEQNETDAGEPTVQQSAGNGKILGREQAFERLEDIASFFEKTEPQSLIPAAIRKIIRRGRLPVEQLLWEALTSGEAREKLFREYDLPQPDSE